MHRITGSAQNIAMILGIFGMKNLCFFKDNVGRILRNFPEYNFEC